MDLKGVKTDAGGGHKPERERRANSRSSARAEASIAGSREDEDDDVDVRMRSGVKWEISQIMDAKEFENFLMERLTIGPKRSSPTQIEVDIRLLVLEATPNCLGLAQLIGDCFTCTWLLQLRSELLANFCNEILITAKKKATAKCNLQKQITNRLSSIFPLTKSPQINVSKSNTTTSSIKREITSKNPSSYSTKKVKLLLKILLNRHLNHSPSFLLLLVLWNHQLKNTIVPHHSPNLLALAHVHRQLNEVPPHRVLESRLLGVHPQHRAIHPHHHVFLHLPMHRHPQVKALGGVFRFDGGPFHAVEGGESRVDIVPGGVPILCTSTDPDFSSRNRTEKTQDLYEISA
ncbi:inactive ribonuclease-like protein 9 [Striga asiatica]|uniref:Inactive ribonuclease-like protein 9 n=1 Tax=Striga asiatica TaxID=4170 RepID=A0A5A7PQV9_STRAF|nr:inactive ribonuclease-like protein 9 [Striga asiatica]